MDCGSNPFQTHEGAGMLVTRKGVSHRLADRRIVDLEVSLAGNTRRVFEALSVPEYMEVWMSIPGHSGCGATAAREADGFIFEHSCSSGKVAKVSGTYLVFLRRKLVYSWRVTGMLNVRDSLVDIRLCGDFERSILRLRHFQLQSDEECAWHKDFWTVSLSRLNRLLGGGIDHPRPHGLRGRQRRPNTYGAQIFT
jgi:uncharacterized protein YndB with AHSA1/START domain